MPFIASRTIGLIEIDGDLPPSLFEIEDFATNEFGEDYCDDGQWESTSVIQADLTKLRAELKREAAILQDRINHIRVIGT